MDVSKPRLVVTVFWLCYASVEPIPDGDRLGWVLSGISEHIVEESYSFFECSAK